MFRSYQQVYRPPCNSTKTQSEVYNCDLCDEGGWLSETDMQIHRKDGHGQELWRMWHDTSTFICLSCTTPQKDKESLIKHIKTDHLLSSENALRVEREIFICELCSRIFFNKPLLKCHMIKHFLPRKHFQEKPVIIKCPKCKKRLKMATLWNHMGYHRLLSVSVCPICLEKCLNKTDLQEHLKKHPKHYHCNICGYSTIKYDYFNEHVRTHKQKNKVPSKDIDVERYFLPSLRVYKQNYLVQYPVKGLKLFNNISVCILCREICTSNTQMKRHILCDHYSEKVENKHQYVCYCGEEFFNNVLLKQHLFKNHQDSNKADNAPSSNYVNEVHMSEMNDEDNVDEVAEHPDPQDDQMSVIIEAIENGDIVVQVMS